MNSWSVFETYFLFPTNLFKSMMMCCMWCTMYNVVHVLHVVMWCTMMWCICCMWSNMMCCMWCMRSCGAQYSGACVACVHVVHYNVVHVVHYDVVHVVYVFMWCTMMRYMCSCGASMGWTMIWCIYRVYVFMWGAL